MTSHERIIQLIRRFPYFYERIPAHITKEFDSKLFDEWAVNTAISNTESILATFILMVWDSNAHWQVGPFLIVDAVKSLSGKNLQVIKEWVQEPFFL